MIFARFADVRRLFSRLKKESLKFATAESLTGGLIGAAITAIPGSSAVYSGGVISYSIDAKVRLLGVDPSVIDSCGVVSRETAEAMALGALAVTSADVSVAVTGVAGPDGGTPELPVGTVWMASARKMSGQNPSVISECHHISGNRSRVRIRTVSLAVRLVLLHLDRG